MMCRRPPNRRNNSSRIPSGDGEIDLAFAVQALTVHRSFNWLQAGKKTQYSFLTISRLNKSPMNSKNSHALYCSDDSLLE